MKKDNTKFNIIMQSVYEICMMIIPFITAPYISRILGSDQGGVYSYNYSVVNYFMIVAILGLEAYGARTIARVRDDSKALSQQFTELYFSHVIVSVLTLVVYVLYCGFLSKYKIIAWIQILYVLGQALNISWLFVGLSEHRILVTRNIAFKIIMVICIFTFVKKPDDLGKYVFILSADSFASHALLWTIRSKYARFVKVHLHDVLAHLKPQLILFVSIIAGSIYQMMDKTMIGNMGFMAELGQYEYADKIMRMPLSIITGVGTVMLSRSAHLFSKGEDTKVYLSVQIMLRAVTVFSSLVFFGFLSFGKAFCNLYLGSGYEYSGQLLSALAITVLFISWNSTLRTQFFIPKGKDSSYVIAVCTGAVINILLNAILIPRYNCMGAAIATVISYGMVSAIEIWMSRKELKSPRMALEILPLFICGLVPYLLSRLWATLFTDSWVGLFLQIAMFCLEFALIVALYRFVLHFKKLKQ